jgi:hypothetical protein
MRPIIRFALVAGTVALGACSSSATEPTHEVNSGYIYATGDKAPSSGYIYASGDKAPASGYMISTGRVCDPSADPSCTP